ncbi:hypothetical protein G7Y89_g4522 [Cudoniella acicularis]|uniref:Heterokaryon incompatibility domain-containing protein n=1 Tax=Cudoniella acicularis TaxID=354080 RepID=A0A8H4W4M1_9HELO|nr:hypothetical protein G7Y89_g4522 [Cudoniella acicularis]
MDDDLKEADIESGSNGLEIDGFEGVLALLNYNLPRDRFEENLKYPGYPCLDFHVVADLESLAARNMDVIGRYRGDDVLSDDYATFIEACLSKCLECHIKCNRTLSGLLPIDARVAPLPTRWSYTALSHRWALETKLCCTTTNNDAARQFESLWLERLPAIFRDILNLARRLKVQYVWIDTLCIIQHGDNGDD